MLEPCDAKVSRTVLRGLGDRKVARLIGRGSRPDLWEARSEIPRAYPASPLHNVMDVKYSEAQR
jgi:hypothetical protein